MKNHLVPRSRDILFIAIYILAILQGTRMLNIDSDLGRHLTLGNYIIDHRKIPTTDLFSHTLPNQPRPPYEWLAQVVFALAFRSLHLDGVIILTAFIIAATFTLIYQHTARRSRFPILALILSFITTGASSLHWLPRPHIFTFLFLALWIDQLDRFRKEEKMPIWHFPAIMLIWANTHGGFVFGILAWGAYFAGWLWDYWRKTSNIQTGKTFFFIGTPSLLATIITPDLWHNWDAVLNNRSAFILNRTTETMRPDISQPYTWLFFFILGITVALFIINRRSVSASHVFLLAGLGFASLLMTRNIPLFVIAAAPILGEQIGPRINNNTLWLKLEERYKHLHASTFGIYPLVALISAAGFFANNYATTHQPLFQFNPQVFPVHATDWMETHPQPGNMFNNFNWGGYLLYRLWPQDKVFLDSQTDFYGEPLVREYDQAITARDGWETILDKYHVEWAIIPLHSPLAKAMRSSTRWQIVYQDDVSIIFTRAH